MHTLDLIKESPPRLAKKLSEQTLFSYKTSFKITPFKIQKLNATVRIYIEALRRNKAIVQPFSVKMKGKH